MTYVSKFSDFRWCPDPVLINAGWNMLLTAAYCPSQHLPTMHIEYLTFDTLTSYICICSSPKILHSWKCSCASSARMSGRSPSVSQCKHNGKSGHNTGKFAGDYLLIASLALRTKKMLIYLSSIATWVQTAFLLVNLLHSCRSKKLQPGPKWTLQDSISELPLIR